MAKFHINNKGVPAICNAKLGACPLGDEGSHFESKEIAQEFIDSMREDEHGILPNINEKINIEIYKDKLDSLFEDLVPHSGKSDTVAGELVRAMSKIGYRFYNDGDQVNSGYGNETCNSSLRYITAQLDYLEKGEGPVGSEFTKLWEGNSMFEDEYEDTLNDCLVSLVNYIETNPQLKSEVNKSDSVSDYQESSDCSYYDEDEEESDSLYESEDCWDDDEYE